MKRRFGIARLTLGMLLVGVLLLGACGRKGNPVPPELVEPGPPTELAASSTPQGVRLTWVRPTKYTRGGTMNDLDHFVIERADAEAPLPTFSRVGELALADRLRFQKERHMDWIDAGVVPGRRYLYRVTAVTADGDRSAFGGPIEVRYEKKDPEKKDAK